jgi:signal transduction histidine kinase
LERGQLTFEPELFPLRRSVEETLDLFAVQAAEKGLELSFNCSPSLDTIEVLTDPHRLRQVLLNLVGNAVKFTDSGSVTLALSRITSGTRGPRLRCEVSDTGPGIDVAHVDRLFQRFSQIDNSNRRRSGGTGLGLAICKAIVSAMDGDIGVSTETGGGARFWFEIPVQMIEPRAEEAFSAAS